MGDKFYGIKAILGCLLIVLAIAPFKLRMQFIEGNELLSIIISIIMIVIGFIPIMNYLKSIFQEFRGHI